MFIHRAFSIILVFTATVSLAAPVPLVPGGGSSITQRSLEPAVLVERDFRAIRTKVVEKTMVRGLSIPAASRRLRYRQPFFKDVIIGGLGHAANKRVQNGNGAGYPPQGGLPTDSFSG